MSVPASSLHAAPSRRSGRARMTTRAELASVGLALIVERGFDHVTVDDIAAAAGISRRTFFRYFASKNDLPWGDFDLLLAEMREHLDATPPQVPLFEALCGAVITFNTYSAADLPRHRERMNLLFSVPTLNAHGTLRYQAWREVLAGFVARRTGQDQNALAPQTVGWAFLAASLAGYEYWLAHPESSLTDTLSSAQDLIGDLEGL